MEARDQSGSCACRQPHALARRGLLRLAGATATIAACGAIARARPARAQSASGYRAMLLSCVDPRTQAPIAAWMDAPVPGSHATSLLGKYSQFTVAGAMVGVTAPAFAGWERTFWDNLAASVHLHGITTLLAVDHGNCGAVGLAYGQRVLDDKTLELHAHMADARRLQEELAWRHPDLDLQAWFVDRDDTGGFTRWQALIEGQVIA